MKQQLPQDEYLRSLPTKRAGVAVLFFDETGKILIVKPNYKEGWQVPGGTIDTNESPKAAAIREVQEEIGIVVQDLQFLCVEHTVQKDTGLDFLEFMFLGGTLTENAIASIILQNDELDEFKFVTPDEALILFRKSLKRRVPIGLEAMETGKPTYSEF